MKSKTLATSPYYSDYQLRPYNPSELYQKFTYTIYDDMREDDQIFALLSLKKNLIINAGFQIQCEDEDIQEFLEWNFEQMNFSRHLFEILSAFDYGFSLTEKIFTMQETPFGGKICLSQLKTRPPHTFEFHQDDYGDIEFIRQNNGNGIIDLEPKYFIHYINNAEFDNPYGNSDLNKGVYTAWWSKKAIMKFWNMHLERFGNPIRIARYEKQRLSDQERSDIISFVKNLQSNAGAVISKDIEIQLLEANKNGEGFDRAIDKYNLMIARKMLIPDLLGLGGAETSGGSYSLGEVQFDMFLQTLEQPRHYLERLIKMEILDPLIEMNFGKNKADAFLVFNPVSDKRKIEYAKIFLDAKQKGAINISERDENWFREIIGMEPVEDFMSAQDKAPQIPGMPEQPEADAEPQDQEEPPEEQEADVAEQPEKEYALSGDSEWDKQVNYEKIKNFFDGKEAQTVESVGQAIKESVNGVFAEIKKKNIASKGSAHAVNQLKLKNWGKVRSALKSAMVQALKEGRADVSDEIGQVKKNIAEVNPVDIDASEFVNSLSFTLSDAAAEEILKQIKLTLYRGIQSGWSYSQILQEMENALAPYDTSLLNEDGTSSAKLNLMVRNAITTVYNEGRRQAFYDNLDQVKAFRFSAIIDGRTSDRCLSLHGMIFSAADAVSFWPPLHHNCRSIMTAITNTMPTPIMTPADKVAKLKQVPKGAFK